jgi:putative ABC transport system permease protein
MRSLTLVRKNLFRKKLRFILLFLSILIAFFLYGALMSVKTLLEGGGDATEANRMITLNKINFTQFIPISYVNRVRAVDGVKVATHLSWFGGYYKEPKNFLTVFAGDPDVHLDVYPEVILSASERETFQNDRTAMIVGKLVADQYGWKVGQRVPLFSNIFSQKNGSRSWDFLVAGIWTTNKKNAAANTIIINYDYFNETRSFGKDEISQVVFLTKDASFNGKVKAAIDTSFANSQDATDTITEQQFAASFAGQAGNLSFIIRLVVGVSFLTILIIVGNTMVMTVRERTREIGILKTLGFSARKVLAMVVGEALLIALIGGFAGLLLANLAVLGIAQTGFVAGISMDPAVWVTGFLWMILLGLLTAAAPAYHALKLNIVTALGRK